MISVESLNYSAGKFHLSDVSMQVQDGDTLVILGPTGAGKTVLLELVAGFRRPKSGSVFLDGRDLTHLPPEKRTVGFVYQDYLLFPHLNVFDNIAYGLRAAGWKSGDVRNRVNELSAQLAIDHLLERRTRNLSGGESQRVALARALITDPHILLLDEPFAAVDPNTKEKLMHETSRILESQKKPVIYVTHDQIEAVDMADRIAVMNEGKIVQIGLPGQVFNEPKSEFVANFMGTRNILKGKAKRERGLTSVDVGGVVLLSSVAIDGDVHVTIRPEDILVSTGLLISSARNSIKGRVTGMREKGSVVLLTADCGVELTAAITRESLAELQLSIGDEIYLTCKASNVNLF
ncbi:MAG: ABC transporter ATP-binding protein [Candidatus Thermoplasmatota archaeon]|nr:ABC transporter ATP-binding protein [Candidatus Thermoplasmatota archaeon]